jgi:Helicase associated domain
MNKLFGNSYLGRDGSNNMGNGLSKKSPFQSDSLLGMALYDFDCFAADVGFQSTVRQSHASSQPVFHPVDDYKDLTLREILDLSDDIIINDDTRFISTSNQNINDFNNLLSNPFVFNSQPPMVNNNLQTAFDVNALSHQDHMLSLKLDQQQMMLQHQNQFLQLQGQQQVMQPQNQNNFMPEGRNKRAREMDEENRFATFDDDASEEERRFRPYQAGQWSEKFQELSEFREKTGHCLVPHTYKENLALARWVKRQRYQYKLMLESKSSTMTPDRVKALDEIGFVWDSQGAAWGDRLGELEQFRQQFMHCNVPSNFSDNPRLATWIKCQRRQYKLFLEGKPSNMTPQRIQHLERLGFEWGLRSYKKQRKN